MHELNSMRLFPKVIFGMPEDFYGKAVFDDGDTIKIEFRGVYDWKAQIVYISTTREKNHGFSLFRVILHEFLHHIANITNMNWIHSILDFQILTLQKWQDAQKLEARTLSFLFSSTPPATNLE